MRVLTTTVAVALFAAIIRATTVDTEGAGLVAPRLLSQTGLYSDAASLTIDTRNRSFSPQYPLWSDGAAKRRWVQLPAGSTIDISNPERWEMPIGAKFWKEFSFNGRRIETRLLWRTGRDRWVFASYAWNGAQTDAELAPDTGIADVVEIEAGKRHSIPSLTECRACHDSNRTELLGFNALQLSDDRDPNALHAEPLSNDMVTLKTLIDEHLVSPRRTDLVANPPRIDAASPLTRAALGYLKSNCGSCHNMEGSIAALGLDLRNNVECSAVGRRGHWIVPEAPAESRIINPGHPEASALLRRMRSRRPLSQMPSIGTVVVDRQAVEFFTNWIANNGDELRAAATRCSPNSL
jgi:cytochrome c553